MKALARLLVALILHTERPCNAFIMTRKIPAVVLLSFCPSTGAEVTPDRAMTASVRFGVRPICGMGKRNINGRIPRNLLPFFAQYTVRARTAQAGDWLWRSRHKR